MGTAHDKFIEVPEMYYTSIGLHASDRDPLSDSLFCMEYSLLDAYWD